MNDNILVLGGDDQTLEIPFNADVRGTAASETLQITGGAEVQFGAGAGDRVEFGRDLSAYTFSQSGNELVVEREDGVTAQLAVNGTFEAAFQDGSADVDIGTGDAGLEVTVGGEAAGSGFDPGNVSLDPDGGSQIAPPDGGSTGFPALPANGGPSAVQTGTADSENINANQDATISGAGGEDRFVVDTNNTANLTIDDFADGDQVFFNVDQASDISVNNVDFNDGEVTLVSGQASVTLTNLGDADGQIFDVGSFESVFGDRGIGINGEPGGEPADTGGDDDDDDQSGAAVTASGDVLVDGTATTTIPGMAESAVVGDTGEGELTISQDGSANFSQTAELARAPSASATVSVSGGSLTAGSLDVGQAGMAELTVQEYGELTGTYMSVGGDYVPDGSSNADFNTGGNGTVRVDEATLDLNGVGANEYGAFLTVGQSGTGSMDIVNGGDVDITSQQGAFPGIEVGDGSLSSGTLTVDGDYSSLEIEGGVGSPGDGGYLGYIAIGNEGGTGETIVRNGGSIENDPGGMTIVGGSFPAAASAESDGSLTVTGSGPNGGESTFDAGDQLVIGGAFDFGASQPIFDSPGTGSVTVENGATLSAGQAEGDGETDIFVGSNGSLQVADGATLNGDVETGAGGTFEPGNSPGLAIVQGDFDARGETTFELEGTDSGSFDRIEVAGDATLGGDVTVDVGDDFAPVIGETFAILDAEGTAALAGGLSLAVEGLPDGTDVDLSVDDGTISATIVDDPAAIA